MTTTAAASAAPPSTCRTGWAVFALATGGFAIGTGASALAQDYGQLVLARFLSGIPHGQGLVWRSAYAAVTVGAVGFGGRLADGSVPLHRRTSALR